MVAFREPSAPLMMSDMWQTSLLLPGSVADREGLALC